MLSTRALAVGLVVALVSACGHAATPENQVQVFAASSLRTVFSTIADGFGVANPTAAVDFSFGGSADLLTQLTNGAAGDVFASADSPTMERAVRAGLVGGTPVAFATNTLTIAVAPGNPKGIKAFHDLATVSTVVCAETVPCGAALPRLERETGTDLAPVSEESSVADVLNKVVTGQADAGLVYVTDTRAAGEAVTSVPFPEAAGVVNMYRIAVLKTARNLTLAERFAGWVTGPSGRAALAAAGFGAP